MRALCLLACLGGITMTAFAQAPSAAPEKLLRTSTSFSLIVHASYEKTAPLFGPDGERAWAGKHWDPQFIYPHPGHDVEGAVFTIRHGQFKAVWVNTQFDTEAKHFQYVYFLPDLLVTTIDVRFNPLSADQTSVNVIYTRTSLSPEGNEHVAAMTEDDQSSGKEWQAGIDAYLEQSHKAQH